jgi:tripartite-type tricarboxylate transporter receptor subunit TctC
MKVIVSTLLLLALISLPIEPTTAQEKAQDYPSRQVTFVVPFAPGGGTDILGRLVGQKLGERFGKSFVVENRPGAGTLTAALQVVKSAPDGYTIMMATSSTLAINPTLYKKLPYEPGKDLIPVAMICGVPFVLVVNPDLPINSVADLVALAKQRPLSYGSGGTGAFHHLMGEYFKSTFGIQMAHVPYRGTLPALNDVIAGHIQLMFADMAPAMPLIRAGKARAIGVTTKQRAPSAPDIAPLAEVGAPTFDWAAWQSVAAPGATPKDIVAKLNGAVNEAIADPEVVKQLVAQSFLPVGKSSPEEFDSFMRSEITRFAKVVEQAGVAGSE